MICQVKSFGLSGFRGLRLAGRRARILGQRIFQLGEESSGRDLLKVPSSENHTVDAQSLRSLARTARAHRHWAKTRRLDWGPAFDSIAPREPQVPQPHLIISSGLDLLCVVQVPIALQRFWRAQQERVVRRSCIDGSDS